MARMSKVNRSALMDYAQVLSAIAVLKQEIKHIEDIYDTLLMDMDDENDTMKYMIMDDAIPALQQVVDALKETSEMMTDTLSE